MARAIVPAHVRILAQIVKTPGPLDTECWIWQGKKHPFGYGQWNSSWGGTCHRIMWKAHRGPIPKGVFVLHKCDVPACCNPDHLFLGTQADNIADAVAKGRTATGERNGSRKHPERVLRGVQRAWNKLTEDQVRAIRADSRSQAVIGKEHGVCRAMVYKIKKRMLWKHLP